MRSTSLTAALKAIEELLVSSILPRSAQEQFAQGAISHATLEPYVTAIKAISDAYTSHTVGSALSQPVRVERDAEAYALYYLLINAAKVCTLLSEISLPSEARVLDFGCGPGTGTLATLATTASRLTIECVENSGAMRKVASRLVSNWPDTARISSLQVRDTFSATPDKPFDLIIAANVFAELAENDAATLLNSLAQSLAPKGYLLLVEPGQLSHTRRLMQLRDTLMASFKEVVPLFPCCRTDACPMLASSETDWCHGTIHWERTALIRQLDKLLSFNKHRIKYAGFVFQKGGILRSGYRVVLPSVKSRLGVGTGLCGSSYFGPVLIRKRDRTPETRPLEKADVFELVTLSKTPGRELPSGTQVISVE
jgi:ribosomal protein RSM22 (predicted rRNA methylase)